jgi:Methyltransferase domain
MEEVHLWRGTAEQRALRGVAGKSGVFRYFAAQLGSCDWSAMTVLDFGGNVGNILADPDCTILPERYYCLDVVRNALDIGRERYPNAHWVHYDRYNFSFNPGGVVDLPVPDLAVCFDVILAYSVFTHIGLEEMRDLVGQLRTRLSDRGTLAFTFIDANHVSWPDANSGNNLRWRVEQCRDLDAPLDVDALLERSRGADWCTLVNGRELYVNGDVARPADLEACETYHVYYTVGFLQKEFPEAMIRLPVNEEMQHCCILERPA